MARRGFLASPARCVSLSPRLLRSRDLRERNPLLPGRLLVLLRPDGAHCLLGKLAVSLPVGVSLPWEWLGRCRSRPLCCCGPVFFGSGGLVSAEKVALPCFCGRGEWESRARGPLGWQRSCHPMPNARFGGGGELPGKAAACSFRGIPCLTGGRSGGSGSSSS